MFSINKLKRTHNEALFSAVCMLGLYTTFFILGLLTLIGIVIDNPISKRVDNIDPIFVVVLGVIIFFLWCIRYYKIVGDINLKIAMREQDKSNRNMRKLITFILIAVPILFFVPYWVFVKKW